MAALRLVLALAAAAAAGFFVHLFRHFPMRTTVITAFTVGAFTYVAVQTVERLALLLRRSRRR